MFRPGTAQSCISVLLFCAFLAPAALTANTAERALQFNSRVWQVESRLPQNAVQAVVQTDDGFLWLGTQAGLARFDGYGFQWFDHPDLKYEKINALAVAPDQSLWVGTASRGVYRVQHHDVTHFPLNDIADPRVLSICVDPDGAVWAGTVVGLVVFDGKKFKSAGVNGVLSTDAVRAIARKNHLHWFASAGRVIVTSNSVPIKRLRQTDGVPSIYLRALLATDDGTLWIGSNAGLSMLKEGTFTHYSKSDGLPDDTVSALFLDSNNRLWVGTYSGLCRKVGERFVPALSNDGEPFDQILAITEDREHNLWAGTKDGLIRLREDRFKTFLTRDGLAHNNVISILGDDAGLWIGTWGGGLHHFNNRKPTIWSRDTHPALKTDLILALHKARDGSLWIGTDYDGGLYRLHNGAITKLKEPGGRSHAVRDIHQDREGTFWIATSFGLLCGNETALKRYLPKDGLPTEVVRCVAEDAGNVLWIGTEKGLARFVDGSIEALPRSDELSDEPILSLYADAATNVWVGTSRGLVHLTEGKIVSNRDHNPLLTNAVAEILEDDLGFLWLSSDRGIIRVKKSDLLTTAPGKTAVLCDHFGQADGMMSSVCVGTAKPAAWKSSDGMLWFASTRGMVATDSRRAISKNTVPPPIFITRFSANRRLVPLERADTSVDAGNGDLEFDYTALSFQDPERNRFRYRLVGYDVDWIEAGTRRTAYYNNLPPGRYEFRVIACNKDGIWNEQPATIAFTLLPHVWQAKWFQFSGSCGVILLAGFFARHVTKRRLQARLTRLEQEHAVEKERTRIAQDMHDELGARITEILLVGKSTLQNGNDPGAVHCGVQRICAAAQEIATDLNAIVFAVNPRNDSLEKFVAYICKYVEKYLGAASVRCRLDVPLDVPDLPVSSEVRHHAVMSIKEALNNALKHSQATLISVEVKLDGNKLRITIADDGKGFDASQIDNLGNGLTGMKKRMDEIDASIETVSGPGNGTRIRFDIPLKG